MRGDSDVVFAVQSCGKPHMTAGLPRNRVAVFFEKFSEFFSADFPGKLRIAITSSFTIWRRAI